MNGEKKFVLGQYFTKKEIVEKVVDLLNDYKKYDKTIKILEPSFGSGNFIEVLKRKGYNNIIGCEIDSEFTKNTQDFFLYPLEEKFNLVIGNPPFSKYNLKESYYYSKKYFLTAIHPNKYLPHEASKKEKIQIENAFILKSIKHLKDKESSIGFVLPISFFIAKKRKYVKKEILKNFDTIIIYQNDLNWFDYPIPCCFAILTNLPHYKDKAILIYEDKENVKEILDKDKLLDEELIPKTFLYKKNNSHSGILMSNYLSEKSVKYKKSYKNNNVSAANILEKKQIPEEKVSDYCLAIARVGNGSVGKAGLINVKEDTLNDMFYVFEFKEPYNQKKELKEEICRLINQHQEHFQNSTIRVGSKSIKKSEVFNFRVKI